MGIGQSAQKEANRIAQEQLTMQTTLQDEAKAKANKLELEAEAERKRQEEERLVTTNTKITGISRGLGRMVR